MSAQQVATVEATVVTFAAVALVMLAVVRVASPERFNTLRTAVADEGFALAAMVAIPAMAASLWFSERAHFPPCELCWYQRIAMYPLALLLPIAAVRRDRSFRLPALVLATLGLAVNVWHLFVETFPSVDTGSCDPTNPCTIRWVEAFGFWTIPRMTTVCFLTIVVLLTITRPEIVE